MTQKTMLILAYTGNYDVWMIFPKKRGEWYLKSAAGYNRPNWLSELMDEVHTWLFGQYLPDICDLDGYVCLDTWWEFDTTEQREEKWGKFLLELCKEMTNEKYLYSYKFTTFEWMCKAAGFEC